MAVSTSWYQQMPPSQEFYYNNRVNHHSPKGSEWLDDNDREDLNDHRNEGKFFIVCFYCCIGEVCKNS